MDSVDELLAKVSLPPAPKLLPQLLAVLSNPDSEIERVVDLIAFDPTLTVKVLQVCNGALYGLSYEVTDVGEAVGRLGYHSLYHIVAVLSGEKFLTVNASSGVDPEVLWRHAVSAAFSAKILAQRVGLDDSTLFTAGLVHDIGKLPLVEALQGEYGAMITDPNLYGRSLQDLERSSFGLTHAEVGARLLEKWEFPPQFAELILHHHDPEKSVTQARACACVDLADLLAHSVSDANITQEWAIDIEEPALRILNLTPERVAQFREEILENMSFVEKICRSVK